MAQESPIEWTDKTWNPVRGCFPVSPGCANCYAMSVTRRFNQPGQAYDGLAERRGGKDRWTGIVRTYDDMLMQPLKWKKGVRIFVNSMSDLFHEYVPFEFIDKVFAVMALCPQHTFQILTKRPERMAEYLNASSRMKIGDSVRCDIAWQIGKLGFDWRLPNGYADIACQVDCGKMFPLPNVWLGVSVENQQTADERIPLLLRVPAVVRFLSMEPLLGKVILNGNLYDWDAADTSDFIARPALSWIICGGESGSNARPMHPQWARSLRDECEAAGVPFFFKQWGEAAPFHQMPQFDSASEIASKRIADVQHGNDPCPMYKVGKKAAGRLLDGREHNDYPSIRGTDDR